MKLHVYYLKDTKVAVDTFEDESDGFFTPPDWRIEDNGGITIWGKRPPTTDDAMMTVSSSDKIAYYPPAKLVKVERAN